MSVCSAPTTSLNPYVSETLFTFSNGDVLEVIPFDDKYSKMLNDEREGFYTRVGFKDDAPRMFYMGEIDGAIGGKSHAGCGTCS